MTRITRDEINRTAIEIELRKAYTIAKASADMVYAIPEEYLHKVVIPALSSIIDSAMVVVDIFKEFEKRQETELERTEEDES
jgi:hypothetical protein